MAVDGSYRVAVEAMGRKGEGIVTLKSNGTALEGMVDALGMKTPLEDGKVSGDSFTGSIEGDTPLGTMRFKVTGAVKGDKIEGKLSAGLVKANFVGERV